MEIIQDQYGIFLCQEKYAKDLLKRFHMSNCNPASTPMNTNERLVLDDGVEKADEKEFRSIVGGLIYLTHSRPDIMFAVSLISRFMHKPSRQHMGAAKRVLRYIRGTLSFGLRYQKVSNCKLISYTDSDWAGCADDRKSTSGYAHSFGSGVISWASKKQQTIALSSSEAEYMAATSAACQTVWLRRILADLKEKQDEATIMFCDNKSTIAMTKNPVFHGRTKHIEIRHHFIRELVAKKEIKLEYRSTEEQVADIFTKAPSREKFFKFRKMLGVEGI